MQAACYAVILASEGFALGFDNSRLSQLSQRPGWRGELIANFQAAPLIDAPAAKKPSIRTRSG